MSLCKSTLGALLGHAYSRAVAAIIVVGFVCLSAASVSAQVYSNKEYVTLKPITDVNGVDVTFGTFNTPSPFSIAAPGAGNLKYNASFSGGRMSHNLDVYLVDESWVSYGYPENQDRDIRVKVSGSNKYFHCQGFGACAQVTDFDGYTLNRSQVGTSYQDAYTLTGRDGTVYSFFNTRLTALPPCNGPDDGCNAAYVHKDAYVHTITYSSGEKLTFDDYEFIVRSNLGYELTIQADYSNGIYPGDHWLRYRHGIVSLAKLSRGQVDLQSISTTTSGQMDGVSLFEMTQTDAINRTYKLKLTPLYHDNCPGVYPPVPQSPRYFPTKSTDPNGLETDIVYHFNSSAPQNQLYWKWAGDNNIPVKSVTRDGVTWNYDTVNGMQITDPYNGVQLLQSILYWAPSNYPNSQCIVQGEVASRQVVSQKDQLNNTTVFEYDSVSRSLKKATLPEQNEYRYEYDSRQNLTKAFRTGKPSSGMGEILVYEANYDTTCTNPLTCNKPNWIRDAKGATSSNPAHWTHFTYEPVHGGLKTVKLPANSAGIRRLYEYTYESHSTGDGSIYRLTETQSCTTAEVCTNQSELEKTVTTYWGDTFLPQSVTHKAGDSTVSSTTTYAYDNAGRVIQVTDPNGLITYSRYDAVGRLEGQILPPTAAGGFPAKRLQYNAADQVTVEQSGTVPSIPNAWSASSSPWSTFTAQETTTHTYDLRGRKTKTDRVGGADRAVTQYSYDNLGRLVCTAVRMNPAIFDNLPTDACTLGAEGTQGADRITKNVYDAAGQVLQVRKGVGTSVEIADATYTYTANGKTQYVIDANGDRSKYQYDGYDRRTHWFFPSPTSLGPGVYQPNTPANALLTGGVENSNDYELYGYDENDNQTSIRRRDNTFIDFGFDRLNQKITKVMRNAPTTAYDVTYGYDARGLQTTALFSTGGLGITNEYDALGRITSSTSTIGSASRQVNYLYDAGGRRVRMTWPDGFYVTYDYAGRSTLAEIRENNSTAVVSFVYDTFGRRKEINRPNGVKTTLLYDGLSRVSQFGQDLPEPSSGTNDLTVSFGRNPASQITSQILSNALYEPVAQASVQRPYEINGLNQMKKSGTTDLGYDLRGNLQTEGNPVLNTYNYDPENRLLGLQGGTALSYDPLGRLAQSVDSATTQFTYDGANIIGEYNGSNVLQRRYVHGVGTDEPLLWYEGTGVGDRRNLIANHQGSIVGVTAASGSLIHANTYDEYGVPGSSNLGLFQYTGQVWLENLSLYHYKARAYSPYFGRFMQTDPTGYDDGLNWYEYVGNDPVNSTDPAGTLCITPAGTRCEPGTSNGRSAPVRATAEGATAVIAGVDKGLGGGAAATNAAGGTVSPRLGRTVGFAGAAATVAGYQNDVSKGMPAGQAAVKNGTSMLVGAISIPEGAGAGFAAGAAITSETGPGAAVGGLIGAALGALFADTAGDVAGNASGAVASNIAKARMTDNSSQAIAHRLAPLTCPRGICVPHGP